MIGGMDSTLALAELRRELAVRQSVYPQWVGTGKLSQRLADHRLAAIEWAIPQGCGHRCPVDFIEQNAPPEQNDREQLSLFGGEP